MSHRELEGLWRPAIEIWGALAAFTAAGVIWMWPEYLLLSPLLALFAVAALAAVGVWRLGQWADLTRRRFHMFRERPLAMSATDIPIDPNRTFLGLGFAWQARHSQRLYEARNSDFMVNPPALMRLFARFGGKAFLGGDTFLHGIETTEKRLWMNNAERVGHTLVVGTTRVGKTRLAEVLIAQDIHRGDPVIVLDPKGDLALLKRVFAEARRAGREKELYIFHLGYPTLSCRYNPIADFSRITEVAGRISSQLPASGQSAAFKQFAWRYVNVITRVQVALGLRPSYQSILAAAESLDPLLIQYGEKFLDSHPRHKQNWRKEFKTFEQNMAGDDNKFGAIPRELKTRDRRAALLILFLRDELELTHEDSIMAALESIVKYDRSYFDKLVASLLPFLEKVTTGNIAPLLSPMPDDLNDRRPVIEWRSMMNRNAVVYVGLDTLTDPEVGAAVGFAMFSDLKSTAGEIYKHGHEAGFLDPDKTRNVCVHADEMAELAGEEVTGLLNKAGGAGFRLTLYTQTLQDLAVKLGSRDAAQQQIGNLNATVMLRVQNQDTARLLTDKLTEVELKEITTMSGTTDHGEEFASRTEDRISKQRAPLLAPTDLIRLPKGQAFALLDGGKLCKLRIPLLRAEDDRFMPASVEEMMRLRGGAR